MDIFYSIGIAQVLFSLVLIGKKRELIMADKVLMLIIASFGMELGYSWLNFVYLPNLPNIVMFPYLYGPLLFLYAQLMTSEKPRLDRRVYLHFIPFLMFVSLAVFFGKYIYSLKITFVKNGDDSWFQAINFTGFIVLLVYYWLKISGLMKQHRQNILEKFSTDAGTHDLSWINYLTIFVFGGFILFVTIDTFSIFSGILLFESAIPLHIGILIATYSLSFFGFRQEAIFEEQQFARFVSIPVEAEQACKARSDVEHLLHYLNEKKPYLIRNLTLQDVANDLSIPAYRLSEMINNDLNKNFFTLINELRIEEAKQRIVSEKYNHLTLSAIGFDSGFNSKSSFQALFKKYTDMTPSQYKRGKSH
jgi:AraC-like DNA-binding protein